MQLIGFRQPTTAYLLANYLKNQNIAVDVTDSGENGFVLNLQDDTQFEQAKAIVAGFLQNPTDPKYQDAAWQQDTPTMSSSASLSLKRFDFSSMVHVPVVSSILVLCAAIFLSFLMGAFTPVMQTLMILPLPEIAQTQQWWRIVSPAIIHFSELHIVFNLLWWWVLGRQIESRFGSIFLLLFFCVTAAVSNIAQLWVSGPNFGGLSGVVYALMGFVWWLGWLRPSWGISLPKPFVGFMLVWLLIGYADVLWVSMANTAHTMGLVSGCLAAWLITTLKTKPMA
jgi:GlpG protein